MVTNYMLLYFGVNMSFGMRSDREEKETVTKISSLSPFVLFVSLIFYFLFGFFVVDR